MTSVLKQLGTAVPAPDAKAKATMEKLESASKGEEFDKAYIMAQYENHVFLRDHAADYLERGRVAGTASCHAGTGHVQGARHPHQAHLRRVEGVKPPIFDPRRLALRERVAVSGASVPKTRLTNQRTIWR